ncbi:hypothetical protein LJC48_05380 [Desulfovibrio sp. OttesenSCG-928-C06]|nr:hypothetical protein [Desulfovibrio sp. OttesenSCG-928-C06]
MSNQQEHKWSFRHLGGLEQVVLSSAEDFRRLRELDPKLWVALSCPVSGLEFDSRTLELIDYDVDGRIRIPEMLDAVEWACERLKDPAVLRDSQDFLAIDMVRDDTDDGKHIIATMTTILANLGKPDSGGLTQEDVAQSAAHAAEHMFNGDGIIPPLEAVDPDMKAFISDALAVMGGVKDAGGQFGVNIELANAFVEYLRAWKEWENMVDGASSPLGKKTSQAWELMQEVKAKVDDYFLRTDLAAYAPQAQTALNVDEKFVVPVENGVLSAQALAELPLSRIEAGKPLDLVAGLNPEWRERIECFASMTASLLKEPGVMSREDWLGIQKAFEPYAGALDSRPARPDIAVEQAPTSTPEDLDSDRINEILDSKIIDSFVALAEKDSTMPAAAADIAAVERLVLYHRHLYRLLMNFISFDDFYSRNPRAAFQIGTLYLDGRSCELCLPVDNVDAHAALAARSQLYLVYCKCTRKKTPSPAEAPEAKTIVAAITAGDADLLMEKRNGVFVDNHGEDWDATVVKITSNPISLKQAIFEPYKKFGRMISEQISKFASNKDADMMSAAGTKIGEVSKSVAAPSAEAAPKFDIGRNVGIFAAIGLAVGAIGTALATIFSALFAMQWWQFPLLFLGLFLVISGPSMIMAWLKLRQRTLGPLLEASGWAVNGRVLINFFLGRQLTATAVLPPHSSRNYVDPINKRSRMPLVIFLLAVILGGAAVGGWFWYKSTHKASAPVSAKVVTQDAAPATPPAGEAGDAPAGDAAEAPSAGQ